MQTFSNLQRNFINKSYISAVFLGVAFAFYSAISVLSPWFLPFFGVGAVGIYRNQNKQFLYAMLFAALVFEKNHSLYLFSTWAFFFVFVKYIMPILESVIDCKKCLNAIGAGIAYILFFGAIFIINAIFAEYRLVYSPLVLGYWILLEMSISALIYYEN